MCSITIMKGGLTEDEVREMRFAWHHVLAGNIGEFSAGMFLEYAPVPLFLLFFVSSRSEHTQHRLIY